MQWVRINRVDRKEIFSGVIQLMGASFAKQNSIKMSKYVLMLFAITVNLNLTTCVLHKRTWSFASVLRIENRKKMLASKASRTVAHDPCPSKAPQLLTIPSKSHRNRYRTNQDNQLICKDYSNMLWMWHNLRIRKINRQFILWTKKYEI